VLVAEEFIELITAEPKADGRGVDLIVYGRPAQLYSIRPP
jgi:hypothetical protein